MFIVSFLDALASLKASGNQSMRKVILLTFGSLSTEVDDTCNTLILFNFLPNFPFLMLAQYEEEAKVGVQVALGFLCFNFRVSELSKPVIRVMHS